MATYQKVVEMFGESFASWLSLLKKWIDWGVDFQKLFELLQQVKKEDLLGFINGTHILTKPQKIMNYLAFLWTIKIPPVEKFKVGDFFEEKRSSYEEERFKNWILKNAKDLELSLEKESFLNKFILKKTAWDLDIQSDFEQKPIIPIKIFLPLLKSLLQTQSNGEIKEYGLNRGSNLFLVDVSEINPILKVVVVDVDVSLSNKAWSIGCYHSSEWSYSVDTIFFCYTDIPPSFSCVSLA